MSSAGADLDGYNVKLMICYKEAINRSSLPHALWYIITRR